LTANDFFTGLIVIIIFFVAVPFLWQAQEKKKETERAYKDFNPQEDIAEIEKNFFELSRRVKIIRWTPEPRFGEGSVAPRNIHFEAREVLPSGEVVPLFFQMPVLTRTITRLTNDFPLHEKGMRAWSGAKNYDDEPLVRPVYVVKPRAVKARPAKVTSEEEESEGEESEGSE
jgi:cbb3-type cytochrome oxidase subunit 3